MRVCTFCKKMYCSNVLMVIGVHKNNIFAFILTGLLKCKIILSFVFRYPIVRHKMYYVYHNK